MRRRLSVIAMVWIVVLSAAASLAAAPVAVADVSDRVDSSAAAKTKTATPIKHFITLMQENHSFDNYFGRYPGADGVPADACVPSDPNTKESPCVKPFHLEDRSIVSLGHSVNTFEKQYRGGRMDGFISAFAQERNVKDLPMGYYDERDIPYYWNVADNYVLFDRNFTSASGGSVWNHFFWATGSPGNRKEDSLLPNGFDHVPTIFDRLQASGVSWKFYIQNYDPDINFRTPGNGDRAAQVIWAPVLNYKRFLDDPELRSHIVPMEQYYTDLQDNNLPAVSYMVPSGSSEHPPGSIQAGTRFVRNIVNALMASSAWDASAFMWTYDDWGGWYDHVKPPRVDRYGYGFRAPALLVSPYARKGWVDHTIIDFTSQLKFIETNWGVKPLASRDAAANNLTSAFDFSAGPRDPVILAENRSQPVAEVTAAGTVYGLYGAALALPVVLLASGYVWPRRRRPRRALRFTSVLLRRRP